MVRRMPTWEELAILWNALRSNVLGFWGGILGLVFTAIWIFWEKAPMKRVFLTFFVLIFFLSLIVVWLDEYRDHKKDQELYQKSREAWDAGMKDLQAKLKEQPKVVYRDKIVPQPSKTVEPTKEFVETKTAFENTKRELQEKTEQLNMLEKEQKEKADEVSAKKRAIEALIGQLSSLEKQVKAPNVDTYALKAYMNKYNEIVRSAKKRITNRFLHGAGKRDSVRYICNYRKPNSATKDLFGAKISEVNKKSAKIFFASFFSVAVS
jgi:energy-coupling factor transporter transmembrane protein EcfT